MKEKIVCGRHDAVFHVKYSDQSDYALRAIMLPDRLIIIIASACGKDCIL